MKAIILILLVSGLSAHGDRKKSVESMVEEINTLRETLVNGVTENPDLNTFKAVCKPVGMNLKKKAKQLNVKVRQASDRFRNPQHKATPLELKAIEVFKKDSQKTGYWLEKGNKQHYFRRINVLKQCLACHGDKVTRPEFVKKKFPEDKAFGFQQGDLRGIYHVVVGSK